LFFVLLMCAPVTTNRGASQSEACGGVYLIQLFLVKPVFVARGCC